MASTVGLPAGFVIDPPKAQAAVLPAGFIVNQPAPAEPVIPQGSMTEEQFFAKFGDIPDIDGLIAPQAPTPEVERGLGESLVGAGEAALTVGTGITGGTLGAIGGTLQGVISELRSGEFGTNEAANRIADRAEAAMTSLTFAPRTEAGQEIVQTIGEAGEALAPLTGLGGQAAQLGQATKAAIPGVKAQATLAGRAAAPAVEAGKEVAVAAFKRQSPVKQRIARLIEEGATDVETAKFELKEPSVTIRPSETPSLGAPSDPFSKLKSILDTEGPKIQKDSAAVETIKQGFDEGVIAFVKGSSDTDKSKMLKMVNIMESGKKNRRFAAENRPSDVVGDSLMERFRVIRSANKAAGQKIGRAAKDLEGQPIDLSEATSGFAQSLDDLGVRLVRDSKGNLKPDFELSQLSPGDRGPLKEVIRQMNIRGKTGDIDGLTAHKMKKIIDNNVTFGKVKTGISNDAEQALKGFRTGINKSLGDTFPEYGKQNKIYSETIGVLDTFQDVAGRKLNLLGDNVDKSVGTLLRGLLSNNKGRVLLLDSVSEIEAAAVKHGAGDKLLLKGKSLGSDDLLNQILFVDELDARFGPVARTSLAGEVGKEIKRGADVVRGGIFDAAVEIGAKGVEKARGINEQAAFKSIKELLKKGSK